MKYIVFCVYCRSYLIWTTGVKCFSPPISAVFVQFAFLIFLFFLFLQSFSCVHVWLTSPLPSRMLQLIEAVIHMQVRLKSGSK